MSGRYGGASTYRGWTKRLTGLPNRPAWSRNNVGGWFQNCLWLATETDCCLCRKFSLALSHPCKSVALKTQQPKVFAPSAVVCGLRKVMVLEKVLIAKSRQEPSRHKPTLTWATHGWFCASTHAAAVSQSGEWAGTHQPTVSRRANLTSRVKMVLGVSLMLRDNGPQTMFVGR